MGRLSLGDLGDTDEIAARRMNGAALNVAIQSAKGAETAGV